MTAGIASIGTEKSTYLLTVLRELGRLKMQDLPLTDQKNKRFTPVIAGHENGGPNSRT